LHLGTQPLAQHVAGGGERLRKRQCGLAIDVLVTELTGRELDLPGGIIEVRVLHQEIQETIARAVGHARV
jgi:hypothetical protein